jgi:hypothetical protein
LLEPPLRAKSEELLQRAPGLINILYDFYIFFNTSKRKENKKKIKRIKGQARIWFLISR